VSSGALNPTMPYHSTWQGHETINFGVRRLKILFLVDDLYLLVCIDSSSAWLLATDVSRKSRLFYRTVYKELFDAFTASVPS